MKTIVNIVHTIKKKTKKMTDIKQAILQGIPTQLPPKKEFDTSLFVNWLDSLIKNDDEYNLTYNQDSILVNWEFINNRIQSELASNLWGKDYLYFMRLNIDKQFQMALDNFDRAKLLIE